MYDTHSDREKQKRIDRTLLAITPTPSNLFKLILIPSACRIANVSSLWLTVYMKKNTAEAIIINTVIVIGIANAALAIVLMFIS
jgi:hypothetical protein